MSKFNQSTSGSNKTVNKSGHVAYRMEDKLKLVSIVLTSLFGETKYYGDNTNELVQLAKKTDMQFVSKLAIYARKEFHMRSVSHALTAIIANQGKEYVKQTVAGVVERVDDITEILACYIAMYGKPIPNGLKRALAASMQGFNEYQFSKYSGGNKSVKLRDVLRIVHAKPKDKERSELFGKIVNSTLETPYTWETELSEKGNTREAWEQLIESGKVGYMALLRNLRNIIKANPGNVNIALDKLKDKEQVLRSKQLPFRYYSAYRAIESSGIGTSKIYDTLEIALRHSVDNIEKIQGKTLIAIDVSGSMTRPISQKSEASCSDIACLMACMANYICEDCLVVAFDTRLHGVAVSSVGGIIQNAKSIAVTGGGTDLSLPMRYILQEKLKFDRMIMFSDNEINGGWNGGYTRTCQGLADEYRFDVNPDFWVHAVDLQGYSTQQFIGKQTNIIAGWSEKTLEFINLAEQGIETLTSKIEGYNVK